MHATRRDSEDEPQTACTPTEHADDEC
eukprot:COSAG04_NODE_33597_length_138_cov_4934.230769_1_plen_26_part_10